MMRHLLVLLCLVSLVHCWLDLFNSKPLEADEEVEKQDWINRREKTLCSRTIRAPPKTRPHPDIFWGYGIFDPAQADRIPAIALRDFGNDFGSDAAQKGLLAAVAIGLGPSLLSVCVAGLVGVCASYVLACSFCCCCQPHPPPFPSRKQAEKWHESEKRHSKERSRDRTPTTKTPNTKTPNTASKETATKERSRSVANSCESMERTRTEGEEEKRGRVRWERKCEDVIYPTSKRMMGRKVSLICLSVLLLLLVGVSVGVSAYSTVLITELVQRIDIDKQVDYAINEMEHVVCKGEGLFIDQMQQARKSFEELGTNIPTMLLADAPVNAAKISASLKAVVAGVEALPNSIEVIKQFYLQHKSHPNLVNNVENFDKDLDNVYTEVRSIDHYIGTSLDAEKLNDLVDSHAAIVKHINITLIGSYESMDQETKQFRKKLVNLMQKIDSSKPIINKIIRLTKAKLEWMWYVSLPAPCLLLIAAIGCIIAISVEACTKNHLCARTTLCVLYIILLVLVLIPAATMIAYLVVTRSAKLTCIHAEDYSTVHALAGGHMERIKIGDVPEFEKILREIDIGAVMKSCSQQSMSYGKALQKTLGQFEPAAEDMINRVIQTEGRPYIKQLEERMDQRRQQGRVLNTLERLQKSDYVSPIKRALERFATVWNAASGYNSGVEISQQVKVNQPILDKSLRAIRDNLYSMQNETLPAMSLFLEEFDMQQKIDEIFNKVKKLASETIRKVVKKMTAELPQCEITTIYDNIRYQLCDPLSQPVTAAAGAQFLAMICNVFIGVVGVSIARFYVALHMRKTDPYKKCKKY